MVHEEVEPGSNWTGSISLPIKDDLPESNSPSSKWKKNTYTEWHAEVEIEVAGGSFWRKDTIISTSKLKEAKQ